MSQSVKSNLLAAFRYLLKPLVRLALKNEVTFPDFSDALKAAYVDVAARQMASSKMDTTEERISLIANLNVSEVRNILRAVDAANYDREARQLSPLPTILTAWHTDPKYTGPYGVVLDIQFSRKDEKGPSTFCDLVDAYCPGFSPRVLLDELIRIGAVQDVGNGFYRAIKRSYVPEPLSAPSILMLARAVHNLCETLETNLSVSPGPGKDLIRTKGLIQRSIFTAHGIPKSAHAEFDGFIRARGEIFAHDIDNWLSTRDIEGIEDRMQVGVGFYHYIENEEDERQLSREFGN